MNSTYKNRSVSKIVALGFFGLVLLTASCKKFTELNPLEAIAESTAFDTPAGVELVMNGVYQQAAVGLYNGGGGRGYPFGAASIEQGEMRGEDMTIGAQFYQITFEATYTPSTANNVNHWENLYSLINKANVFLEGAKGAADAGVITAEAYASYEGEVRFIRALSHHELLIHFSKPYADGNGSKPGVPYRVTAISTPEAVAESITLTRGTVAEDYTKILEDLNFAEQNLPEDQDNGFQRATKGAAIALKTRILLHQGDWAGVVAEGAKLGATGSGPYTSPIGGYELTDSPDGPFANYSNNTESIFSIANSATSNGGVNGALPNMFSPASINGRGVILTSPNLWKASYWVQGDLRRTLLQQQNPAGLYFSNKYRVIATSADWAPTIRYAEVLLNVAEAAQRSGNTALAFNLLNAVRNRSVPAASQFSSAPSDLLLAILHERRIEFAAEGRRWPDLHRLALDPVYGEGGIPAKIGQTQVTAASYVGTTLLTPSIAAIPYSDFRFLWPFPLSEINSNPTLNGEKNPGY